MGFSVSGAAAIVFTGMFVAFSMWYGASYNGFERVSEAQHDRTERVLATQNSDVEVVTATYAANTLTVEVDNTGPAALDLDRTDVLVDNDYRTDWRTGATIAGDEDTRIWQSGERLHVEFELPSQPDRVRVTTNRGIADATGVTSA